MSKSQPVIASVILRIVRRYSTPDPGLVDDLVQETYLRLCRNEYRALKEFQERHDDAIFGFLKVVAASVVTDHFRSANAQKRLAAKMPEGDDVTESIASPAANAERSAMVREIDLRLDQLAGNGRDKTIFWLYYQHGYTARDIAALPGVDLSPKGVESCIYRLTHALRTLVAQRRRTVSSSPEGDIASSTLGDMR